MCSFILTSCSSNISIWTPRPHPVFAVLCNPVFVSLFSFSLCRDKKLRSPCRFRIWILLLHFYAETLSQHALSLSRLLWLSLSEMRNDTFKRQRWPPNQKVVNNPSAKNFLFVCCKSWAFSLAHFSLSLFVCFFFFHFWSNTFWLETCCFSFTLNFVSGQLLFRVDFLCCLWVLLLRLHLLFFLFFFCNTVVNR